MDMNLVEWFSSLTVGGFIWTIIKITVLFFVLNLVVGFIAVTCRYFLMKEKKKKADVMLDQLLKNMKAAKEKEQENENTSV